MNISALHNFQSSLKNSRLPKPGTGGQVKLKIYLFLFASIFYFLLSSLYSPSAIAQTPQNYPPTQVTQTQNTNPYAAPNTNANVPNNLHTYSQNVLIEVMSAVACQIAGADPATPDGRCLGTDPKTGKIGYVDNGGGAIGFMGNMIGMLYTPPAHTSDYIRNLAQNFGITKHAYARWIDDTDPASSPSDSTYGTGFQSLSPLMNIWSAFRNIAYLLFVLVFVVIGLAIMLRVRIDPRTVMTIQNQIPKIIIGILLVTFSFAIAGFLIDVMWVAIYLFYGVFHGIQGVDVSSLSPQNIAGTTPLGVVGLSGGTDIALKGADAISGIISAFFNNAFGGTFGKILGGLIGATAGGGLMKGVGALLGGTVGTFVAPGLGTVTGASIGTALGTLAGGILGATMGAGKIIGLLGGIVAFLIIAIALLWALIRLWFTLLMAYIAILINIVFAPFWIVGGLIPGSKISFSGWLRNLVGNLSAFPATLVMFLLGKAFMDTIAGPNPYSGQFVPPFIGNIAETKTFGALIGLGIVLTTPGVVKMMRSAFGAPELTFGSVGAAVGVGREVATQTVKQTAGSIFTYKMGAMPKAGGEPGIASLFRRMIR